MKKLLLFAAAATMFAACSKDKTEDINVLPENVPPHDVLQVSVGDEDESRIQLDNGKTVWTQGDKVSVFYKTTGNECYQFTGNTGDTRGSIMKVSGSAGATAIDKNIVIYPYDKDYELDLMNNTVSVVIPSTQRYAKNSYGVGANVMIASSSNNQFTLRNICGWLKLQFTGNAIINAIKIKGNNNEQLAGTAIANYEDYSTFLYGNLANSGDDIGGIILPPGEYAREITLDCGTGLMLSDVPIEFYIALAPQTLSKGISITAECYGNASKINKSTGKSITIARNHIVPVANIDIKASVPNNCIFYTSSDGKIVGPTNRSPFGASIVSNTYENGIGKIVCNGDITRIGYEAFYKCSNLTSIAIPNSVTSIGDSAFYGCSGLTSIAIPDSVTSIEKYAFYVCSGLTSIAIPDSVTSIEKYAFYVCSSLTAFYGKYASADNRCLVQDGKLIAFAPYGLTEYVIPDSVTSIGNEAFQGCRNLTSVTIPDSVTSIGDFAFNVCSTLTSITIPDGVTSIGNYAFRGCSSLTSVTIGNSVKLIGYYVFEGCSSLTSITIPNSVTSIGWSAFKGCSSLASITIGNGIKSIGYYAFAGCTGECIINCNIPNGSKNSPIFEDAQFTKITIGNSVTSIGDYAFSGCSTLKSITIGNSVTSIGNEAFFGCEGLTSITIPDSVTSIGDYAFAECNNLTSVYIDNIAKWCAIEFGSGYSNPLDSAHNLYLNGELVTDLVIPDGVTSIGDSVFSGCSNLTSVTIPDSVTSIGNYAFYECSKLKSVTIGNGVTSIGNDAFSCCSSLTSITIPDSVTSIGDNAFAGSGLTEISLPPNIKVINFGLFAKCSYLQNVYIPNNVTTIRECAFNYCENLTSITIPENVTLIGEGAFMDCNNLSTIYCKPATPPVLQSYIYHNTPSTKIYVPMASVDAYKSGQYWSEYSDNIIGYNF